MNKIKFRFLSILLIALIFILISCTFVPETKPYEFIDKYEESISNTANLHKNSTVGFIYNKQFINSGFIYKKNSELNLNHYYVLTTYENIKDYITDVKIVSFKNNNVYDVKNYIYDENLNLAVFVFHTVAKFDVTNISDEDITVGQNVLSISAPSNTLIRPNARLGIVSRDDDDTFMFDSRMNIGDIGGPVLNLKGEAIGIFINYLDEYVAEKDDKIYGDGINQSYKLASINNYLKNLSENEFNKNNTTFNVREIENSYINNLDYENKQQEIANIISKTTIYIKYEEKIVSSGVIVRKNKMLNESNDYYILSKYNEQIKNNLLDTEVVINNNIYQTSKIYYLEDKDIMLLKINSNQNYLVADTNKIVKLEKGQSVLTNGIQSENVLKNYITAGIVSKINDDSNFMIDAPVNPYQIGGGIYSYEGNLLGIILDKLYSAKDGDDDPNSYLNVEGVSFGIKYSSIANIIDNILEIEDENLADLEIEYQKEEEIYIPSTTHENFEIELVKDNEKYLITVIGEKGHGSGTIFKREKINDEKYLYYVLTNNHVIKDSEEISILFADETKLLAKDFHSNIIHDTAVVRFESKKLLDVKDVSAINDHVGIDLEIGQIVFTIGTPLDLNFYGYVTRGIVSTIENTHNAIYNLTTVIDAPLNPGNSGGALFNMRGQFIGVNVAKLTKAETYKSNDVARGLGLSLNMNVISPLISNIESYKAVVKKPKLGITVTEIKNIETFELPLPNIHNGLIVLDIDESRGSFGKLDVNDILIKIDGISIIGTETVASALKNAKFNDKYVMTFLRYIDEEWVEKTVEIEII